MRWRAFIAALGGAAAWPLTARAQQPKVPSIGVLVVGSPGSEQFWRLFRAGMRELGYVEGQSIRFEFRSDEGQDSRLPELAAELVRLKVDIIVTWFTQAAHAAKQATREIPVVIAQAGNPVENGLVESLARPDAIIVQASLPTNRVAELALRYRIPTVAVVRGFAEQGGLMTYSAAEADMYRHAAAYVDKILKGAKPADLPVEQPTRFDLVINLKTAKALGLDVPQSLLSRADEVIE
jgi:putative ABC transport system substrate-binding protein